MTEQRAVPPVSIACKKLAAPRGSEFFAQESRAPPQAAGMARTTSSGVRPLMVYVAATVESPQG